MAVKFKKGERQYHNILYKKLRKTWYDMMQRCYNEDHRSYKYYGANDVVVCKEWQTLDGFFESVDLVDGWDEDRYRVENLHLDKDIKVEGNKLYSPETCMFVTAEENLSKSWTVHMKKSQALSPTGKEYSFTNREEFSREHELNPSNIYFCLIGKYGQHQGWKFRYEDGTTPKSNSKRMALKEATAPNGRKIEFHNNQEFAEAHGLNGNQIGKVISGKMKHHRQWTFKYKKTKWD